MYSYLFGMFIVCPHLKLEWDSLLNSPWLSECFNTSHCSVFPLSCLHHPHVSSCVSELIWGHQWALTSCWKVPNTFQLSRFPSQKRILTVHWEFTRVHWSSFGFTGVHWSSLGFTRVHCISWGHTWDHKNLVSHCTWLWKCAWLLSYKALHIHCIVHGVGCILFTATAPCTWTSIYSRLGANVSHGMSLRCWLVTVQWMRSCRPAPYLHCQILWCSSAIPDLEPWGIACVKRKSWCCSV